MEILMDSTMRGRNADVRVLMIAPQPYFEARGTPISTRQRLHALSELGYTVDLLTYHVGKDVGFPGLTIHRTPHIGLIREVKIGPSGAKLLLDLVLFFMAFWMLIRRRYDVIHTHEEASYFAMILSWFFDVPHLYDCHSSLPLQMAYNYGHSRPVVKAFELMEKAVLRSAAGIITIDPDLEAYVRRIDPHANQIQIDNLPLHCLLPPVNANRVAELRAELAIDGRIPVVYTGTLEKYQGLDLLIESTTAMRDTVPNIIFVVVGGKQSQVRHYEEMVHVRGVADLFVFVGSVLPEEALAYLSLASILVSTRQGNTAVPLKLYSYLHAAKPILATRSPGHEQVLTDDIALLVDPTAEAISEGLLRLCQDCELRDRLSTNARVFAATMQKDADYVGKVARMYHSLLGLAEPSRLERT